jgi:scyllo-inositol 2-dehydrogenase (NADP+)
MFFAILAHQMKKDKTISAALCSYGMSGLVFHGPLLEAHPGFKITKILERTKNESRKHHPESQLVRNYAEILDDPSIELIVVNTPDHLHYEMAMDALRAGKHVVVEKPFTLEAEHGEELIKAARQRNLVLSVFQNRRWDGDFLTVKEIIESGKLGRLVEFESHFDRYRTKIQPSWKDQSLGTGTLYNLGSHLIDQALQLFGKPERLYASVRKLREGARTDDSFDIFLHYPGFKCLLRSSYLVREAGPRFSLHGTSGSFLKWGTDPQEAALKRGCRPGTDDWGREDELEQGLLHTEIDGKIYRGPHPGVAGNYLAFYDNIYDAIRSGAELEVKAEEALRVVYLIEAAYESSRWGQVLTL